MSLQVIIPDCIWCADYTIRYFGCVFEARMTLVRLDGNRLWIHSPGPIDETLQREIAALGTVKYLIAPGTFHYMHLAAAQTLYPNAETFICPGLPKKRPELRYDHLLEDRPHVYWAQELDQVIIRGALLISEVAFYHRASRTLILVDVIENFTDQTEGVNWQLRLWFSMIFFMWGRPKPAPEYQLSWYRPGLARRCFERILLWDFDRIIVAHGDLIDKDARDLAEKAWRAPLRRMPLWNIAVGFGIIAAIIQLARSVARFFN